MSENRMKRRWRKRTMQMAAFSAKCPYEIGDRVVVLEAAGRNENGVMYT